MLNAFIGSSFEQYLADGLIVLRSSQVERRQVRMIEVEKIKASAIEDQTIPYILGKGGFSVLSDKDIFTYATGILLGKWTISRYVCGCHST